MEALTYGVGGLVVSTAAEYRNPSTRPGPLPSLRGFLEAGMAVDDRSGQSYGSEGSRARSAGNQQGTGDQ